LFVLLKIPLTGNVLFSIFFVWNTKKVKRKDDDSGSIHINTCAFFYRFSLYWNFFFSSPFSHLGDNSRRYQYTCTAWLLLSPVEDRRKEGEKIRREKESTMNLTFRAGHTNEREKWTRLESSSILPIIEKRMHRFEMILRSVDYRMHLIGWRTFVIWNYLRSWNNLCLRVDKTDFSLKIYVLVIHLGYDWFCAGCFYLLMHRYFIIFGEHFIYWIIQK
jgi:hypothetical protein